MNQIFDMSLWTTNSFGQSYVPPVPTTDRRPTDGNQNIFVFMLYQNNNFWQCIWQSMMNCRSLTAHVEWRNHFWSFLKHEIRFKIRPDSRVAKSRRHVSSKPSRDELCLGDIDCRQQYSSEFYDGCIIGRNKNGAEFLYMRVTNYNF